MQAVIKTGGKQYLVEKGSKIRVEKLEGDEGSTVNFKDVLLIDDGSNVQVGTPLVSGSLVSGKILEQYRDDKVIVYKYRRRKRYSKKQGHRQSKTYIEIMGINAKPISGVNKKDKTEVKNNQVKEQPQKEPVSPKRPKENKKVAGEKKSSGEK